MPSSALKANRGLVDAHLFCYTRQKNYTHTILARSKPMDASLLCLHASVVEAVTILQRDPAPLDARAHHALAVLQAALIYLQYNVVEEPPAPDLDGLDTTAAQVDDDTDSVDLAPLTARSLSDYRVERGMRIPAFTAFLGITHQEYAHVIHRQPLDRRVRDQIAYKLGVEWREIAEFMPAQPQTWPEIVPLPAPDGEPLPPEPWYLVDEETGRITSGPHDTPIPANGGYLCDQLTYESTNLVALWYPSTSEEDQLPPEGYSARDLQLIYDESTAEEAARAAADRAALDELLAALGDIRLL
jgi:hypothetical protein